MGKFEYSTLQALEEYLHSYHVNLPTSTPPFDILNREIKIGGKIMGNRLLAQPIEGFDACADGAPGERTVERYCNLAKNGFTNIWLESVAVNEQGRSNPMQLFLNGGTVEAFARMAERIRASSKERMYLVIQLTHSGRNSHPNGEERPVCAFSNPLLPRKQERIIGDDEIRTLQDDYVNACILARDAGFDAVDIRACHGYLFNEFLAAYNRPGKYGGSFENRTRILLETVDRVAREVKIETGVRLNMFDGLTYPYGWGTDGNAPGVQSTREPLRLVRELYARGVRLFNITNGIGEYCPYVIRPYDTGPIKPRESQAEGIGRMLRCAKEVKRLVPDAVVVASAFTWLREFAPYYAAGGIKEGWFDVAGFGRQWLAYPECAADILSGKGMERKKCCVTCCGCTTLIKKQGKRIRCVMRDRPAKEEVGCTS